MSEMMGMMKSYMSGKGVMSLVVMGGVCMFFGGMMGIAYVGMGCVGAFVAHKMN